MRHEHVVLRADRQGLTICAKWGLTSTAAAVALERRHGVSERRLPESTQLAKHRSVDAQLPTPNMDLQKRDGHGEAAHLRVWRLGHAAIHRVPPKDDDMSATMPCKNKARIG